MSEKIAIIGLGYVGLPLALSLAKTFPSTIGFDISAARVEALQKGHDWTGEHSAQTIIEAKLSVTADATKLEDATFFIVTVPTPITEGKQPDLKPLLSACAIIGKVLAKRKSTTPSLNLPVIVFESTVYPGLTEEICGPEIAAVSGLKQGVDFKLGYSPERINPGDPVHTLENITKVIAAEDTATLNRLEAVYGAVVKAGLHKAPSIAVAEAAKVLENTQRDLNVALMNELALICDRMNIRTKDVLDAAGTKWNFLRFTPGLVGGHCIGVDPYYLTTRAEKLGYHPEVILAGRRINDSMGAFIARKLSGWLKDNKAEAKVPRIGILGLTFKENVRDLRNSRVPDIIEELRLLGLQPFVYDPMVDAQMAHEEYGITLCNKDDLSNLDALVLAVPHNQFLSNKKEILGALNKGALVMDIKSVLNPAEVPPSLHYWSL
ncbi:MAG: nucleotide sugar dehydrogenase [Alphaproteobacteria bacterium]|nr:nucleotide sugar dehydrogenase [Alphaproteobacteria bacterium]